MLALLEGLVSAQIDGQRCLSDVYPSALELSPSIIVGHPVPGIVVWSLYAGEYFWEIT